MTVREFLRVVWTGKWFVLASVVIVVGAAFGILQRQTTVYSAVATVQLNNAGASSSASGDTAGNSLVTASPDPSIVTKPDIVAAAAKKLGSEVNPSSLAASVEASYASPTSRMSIQATEATSDAAQAVANAFATAYADYLPTVINGQTAKIDQQMDALRSRLGDVQKTLASSPGDPLAAAERTSIIGKYQGLSDLKTTYQSLVPPGQVLALATTAIPVGLSAPSVLAVALLAGLTVGIGVSFLRRGLDFRVRSAEQAAETAHAPVLGEIEDVGKALHGFRNGKRFPLASRTATPFTESIRELRTAVQVSMPSAGPISVVVTAADPVSPRAFITANLAASWALSGRRTIVFAGDLRRPELEGILPPPHDWAGDLGGLRPTTIPNLEFCSVPDQPLDPADYLATAEARRLIDDLQGKADVLVIDAPPVLAAADAAILGNYADGVILVATVGKTDQVVLSEAADRLRVNDVGLTGLIVAGVHGNQRMSYAVTYGEDPVGDNSAPPAAAAPPSAIPMPASLSGLRRRRRRPAAGPAGAHDSGARTPSEAANSDANVRVLSAGSPSGSR